jgi:hypothetical protein
MWSSIRFTFCQVVLSWIHHLFTNTKCVRPDRRVTFWLTPVVSSSKDFSSLLVTLPLAWITRPGISWHSGLEDYTDSNVSQDVIRKLASSNNCVNQQDHLLNCLLCVVTFGEQIGTPETRNLFKDQILGGKFFSLYNSYRNILNQNLESIFLHILLLKVLFKRVLECGEWRLIPGPTLGFCRVQQACGKKLVKKKRHTCPCWIADRGRHGIVR